MKITLENIKKEKMEKIEKILNNGFKIKRISTKRAKIFKRNEFTRPITWHGFFQLLANSDINLSSHELSKYTGHISATDYIFNWRGGAKLIVCRNSARIKIDNWQEYDILLNYDKFGEMFPWLLDKSLYITDFGDLYKSDKYYK